MNKFEDEWSHTRDEDLFFFIAGCVGRKKMFLFSLISQLLLCVFFIISTIDKPIFNMLYHIITF